VVLAGVVMGATAANLLHDTSDAPFHQVESMEWPMLVVFFFLAGASLEADGLLGALSVAAAYVVLRGIGKVASTWSGDRMFGTVDGQGHLLGAAMLPQAGVALGLALVAAEELPDHRTTIVPVVVASTVVFELVGPIATRVAVARAH
jgi:Kef-type K+ transport system membrane component KefB